MLVKIKYVKRTRSKGRTYYYHRLTHERLPDDRDERAARVLEINRTMKGTVKNAAPGSLLDIIAHYKRSPGYRNLRDRTRHDYSVYLDILAETWGPHPVTSIQRKHALALRDNYLDTPSKADRLVTVLRILLAFAVEREFLKENPVRDIKPFPRGPGHRTWPDEAVGRFLAKAPPTMALAIKLGLYTGQREGDCLTMSWHDYDGRTIRVVQSKTGAKLRIPVHTKLAEALEAHPRTSPIILTTETGKPFTGSNFRHHWSKAMKAAGLQGLTFHGLRYTAAAKLAEAGCSLKEIAAITGHKSLGMIEKYTREADQERLAGAAIYRLENVGDTKNGQRRS